MTDQEIRKWLSEMEIDRDMEIRNMDMLRPLLKELLAYRAFKYGSWWRVWTPVPNPEGWRALAAFPIKDNAISYRNKLGMEGLLVLPWNEEPALTAR